MELLFERFYLLLTIETIQLGLTAYYTYVRRIIVRISLCGAAITLTHYGVITFPQVK